MGRSSSRYRVHLEVRYWKAAEFVQEHAENLGAGGLFIKNASAVEPLEKVRVEVGLPGLGTYRIEGEVAHVLTPEKAAELGRDPGAGIAITGAQDGFHEALSAYLERLGSRADHTVLAADDGHGVLIAHAGYRVASAPPPPELAGAIAGADAPVVGVVVSSRAAPGYHAAAAAAGAGDIVVAMDTEEQLDDVLARLDDQL